MASERQNAHTGNSVCQNSMEMMPITNILAIGEVISIIDNKMEKGNPPKMTMYHHPGTCLYLDMRRAWISSCSLIERRL